LDEICGTCSTYVEVRNAYNIVVRKSVGKIPLRRRGCRWKDNTNNIKMAVMEIRWDGMVWIHLAQNSGLWWDLVNLLTKLDCQPQKKNSVP
jgi:hypothetical protein